MDVGRICLYFNNTSAIVFEVAGDNFSTNVSFWLWIFLYYNALGYCILLKIEWPSENPFQKKKENSVQYNITFYYLINMFLTDDPFKANKVNK